MAKNPEPITLEPAGDLHWTEEFSRTKRNLLWTCSFALLLALVHVPQDGNLDMPMGASGAKITFWHLQIAVWLACAYNAFGFWQQSINVDRLNSKAIYTNEFSDIRKRLTELVQTFGVLITNASHTADQIKGLNPANDDMTAEILQELGGKVKSSLDGFETAVSRMVDDPPTNHTRQIGAAAAGAWQEIERAFQRAGEGLVESGKLRGEAGRQATRLFSKGTNVATTIEVLQTEFNKLSDLIRADHRRFYTYYHKWLTFGIFGAATVASFWRMVATAMPDVISYLQVGITGHR